MKKIGIIDAGTIGQGIANAFTSNGYDVTVCNIKIEWVQSEIDKIVKKLDKLVPRERTTTDKTVEVKGDLRAGECKDLADCDLIVEVVLEEMGVKKELFTTLDEICKDSCILDSNTSSLSTIEVATGIKHNITDMHFFSPVNHMKLVEVIPRINIPIGTKEAIPETSRSLGKTPVEVAEGPGLVINRILVPVISETAFIPQEGIASVEDIDIAMRLRVNHPTGPLVPDDPIGLDIVGAITGAPYNGTKDSRHRYCVLTRKMIRGGKLGQKSGIGFYDYSK